MDMRNGPIFVVSAVAGLVAGILVTRYAPECKEGLCWGQTPFLLMLVGGALTAFIQQEGNQVLAGMISGLFIGLFVSLGGGIYTFLGGTTAFARTEPVTWFALMPNPLIAVFGGVMGLVGALMFLGLSRLRTRGSGS